MSTRLFVSDALSNGTMLELHGEHARYLGRALRARVGEKILVFNGSDGEWAAEILALGKNTARLLVHEHQQRDTESPLHLHLAQAVSRGERMDFVVQKATEIGVQRISPVLTDYGVVKLDAARAHKRQRHWQRIAESACEQSGRIRPPLVDLPLPVNDWFGQKHAAGSTQLILKPGAETTLQSIGPPPIKLCLLIGPEGGFSPKEYQDAGLAGFQAVSLGPRILRTETAALAALTIAQALWGDLAGDLVGD